MRGIGLLVYADIKRSSVYDLNRRSSDNTSVGDIARFGVALVEAESMPRCYHSGEEG